MNAELKTGDLIRAAIGLALYLFFTPALLFIAAGTARWPMAWVYVALFLASTIGSRLVVLKRSPDTLRERARFATAEGRKGWDRVLGPVVGFYGPMAAMIVAGLDQRLGWSAVVPPAGQYVAALVTAGGYGLAAWAMIVNAYFSAIARVQGDRQQKVVTAAPYSIVRHPSYTGALVGSLAVPFMLDALWALVPAAVTLVALVIRTELEDRMLTEELDGYESYSRRTVWRLIPGVW
jgi:protein-S-isoprenylcysteine O-methyltransferase Ste14